MAGYEPEREYDVIVFGDTCVDLVVTGADVVPRFGQVEKLVDDYAIEDVFMPNEQEAIHLSGCSNLEDAAAWLRGRVPVVAMKRGADGARLYSEQEMIECTVSPATGGDSIGAGDSFDAGFLAGWLRGLPMDHCLDIACACGRSVAGAIGGLAGQPTWADVSQNHQPFDKRGERIGG